ncbi:MAG: NYN domain-containing protein [Chloroflexota bacterium]|nr:NYN domain-containing protein [Chloroflexota bacterium]
MVRFFGKPRKEPAAGGAAPRAASSRAVKLEALPAPVPTAAEPAPKPRRRTPARPPRRDWAAEAAATPVDVPAPPAASQATGEEIEPVGGQPAKRRRGTRGGRGRKKPGQAAAPQEPVTEAPPLKVKEKPGQPLTLEQALARQTSALEAFTTQMAATLKGLQIAVADLERRLDQRPETAIAPRVGMFVDVPNVIYAAERRGVSLDFGKVLAFFTRGRELVRATAYAPISDDPSAKLESQRFAHHFIGQPYRLVTKPLKRFADGSMKANFDIELAVDILTMSDRLDVVVLMSGDGDFRRVVELVASRGVRVEVAAFSETAALELKSVADLYIDLADHVAEFKAAK